MSLLSWLWLVHHGEKSLLFEKLCMYIYLILTWGHFFFYGEFMWKRNIHQTSFSCLSYALTGFGTHNLGMCPDWESNQHLLVYGAILQSSELHGQGENSLFFFCNNVIAFLLIQQVLCALNYNYLCVEPFTPINVKLTRLKILFNASLNPQEGLASCLIYDRCHITR